MYEWDVKGKELVKALDGVTDEETIKNLTIPVVNEIRERYQNINSRKRPLKAVKEAVLADYPFTESKEHEYQYFTNKGKGNIKRYEHLALKYLTLTSEEWDVIGDENRKGWKKILEKRDEEARRQLEQQERGQVEQVKQPQQQPEQQPVQQPEEQLEELEEEPEELEEQIEQLDQQLEKTQIAQTTLDDMNISQLELDVETQQMVEEAMKRSGVSLAAFIRRACQVHAKTVTGKVRQSSEDLIEVSTEALKSEKYRTHPGRAEELTNRAIHALKMHNDNCTEKEQKWHINQTAIQLLTGSKPKTIGEILVKYQTMLNDHNDKHELKPYDNRKADKRKIEDEIDLVRLVPTGIDLM